MELYYRVECVDNKTDEAMGGYMCTIMLMLAQRLGLVPTQDDVDFAEAASQSDDPVVKELMKLMLMLGDIPQPPIYLEDKQKYICLYNEQEFNEAIYDLYELSNMLEETLDNKYELRYKELFLEESEIVYEDEHQVVITRDLYEAIKDECDYMPLGYAIDVIEGIYGEEDKK